MPIEFLDRYVTYDNDVDRGALIADGKADGERVVTESYPYSVVRDRPSVQQEAEQAYQRWLRVVRASAYDANYINRFNSKGKQFYISGFIGGYEETVARKDEVARRRAQPPTPPPQPQPAAPPATSPTGATITVINQKHTGDIHTYWVRIADPLHFDEAQDFPLPLVVDFSEVPVSDTTTETTSSSYGAYSSLPSRSYASSSSEATPAMSQKKKPRMYFGKG